MIRNVIFDIGGVFIEWDQNKAFREFGFSDETIRKIQQSMLAPEVWVEEDLSIKSPEELLSGFQARCPECAEEIRYFWEHFSASVRSYPGNKEWIRELQERGKRVYVLSNFGRHCFELVREEFLDFLDIVDGAVISYEVHQVKPDHEIYESLLRKYDLKAEESVFLDDREDNIETARKLGLHVILYKNREQAKGELERLISISDF